MSFTFIHAADLHLGCPFRGLRAVSPEVAEAADAATYRAFERILDLAIESRAAFVLFAGDVYDCEDRNLRAQFRFRAGLEKLHDHGIATYVIHGNHDHLAGASAKLELPPTAHVFPGKQCESVRCRGEGGEIAVVHGYSYPRREVRESVLRFYQRSSRDGDLFRIGLLHGNVGADPDHDNYAPCSLDELRAAQLDYWALGHVHTHRVLSRSGPAAVYPGTPQGLNPRETGPHGCCKVTVREGEPAVEFVGTDCVRWHQIPLSIEGLDGEDALLSALSARLESVRGEDGTSAIARFKLIGRGPLHVKLREPKFLREMEKQVREGEGETPFAWVDRLDNGTLPELDLHARRQAEDVLGDYLRLCDQARSSPEVQSELLTLLGELYGRKELKGIVPDLSPSLVMGLLDRAETTGADLLAGDAG
jgi:DNA repair exonuclease SbcCD nuclease subunit